MTQGFSVQTTCNTMLVCLGVESNMHTHMSDFTAHVQHVLELIL